MKELNYKLVIFDWEGTLIDSKAQAICVLKDVLKIQGLPDLDESQARQLFSYNLNQFVDNLFETKLSIEQRIDLKLNVQKELFSKPKLSILFKGAKSILSDLHQRGAFLTIATNASTSSVKKVLQDLNINKWFDAIVTSDNYPLKPAPDMINALLTLCDCGHDEAVMIGDSPSDLKAAQHAHIDCIGFAPDGDACKLVDYKPKAVVSNFKELLLYLTH